MRGFFVGLFILLSASAQAQLVYQAKISPSEMTEQQKREQIQLSAIKAIHHFAPELGYDDAIFDKKLNEKFSKSFDFTKDQLLQQRFGKGLDGLSDEDKKKFLEDVETKKDVEFKKFIKLNELIQSYNWKTSAQLEIHLDRLKLDRLFKRILSDDKKAYKRLWIVPEIVPVGFDWKDLGLDREEKFVHPLSVSWEKWINENLPSTIEDVGTCESSCRKYFSQWEQKTPDQISTGIDSEFRDGLWGKISLSLKRTQFNASLGENVFEWEGKLVVLDINTKRIVVSYAIPMEKKDWRNLDQTSLNSALASRLYRSPLPFLKMLDQSLQANQLNRVTRLVIKGHKNMSDLLALSELMKSRGSSLGLNVKIDQIRSHEAELLCFYQGEEKSFSDLLSNLKELKSSSTYQLVSEFTGTQHVLKMVNE